MYIYIYIYIYGQTPCLHCGACTLWAGLYSFFNIVLFRKIWCLLTRQSKSGSWKAPAEKNPWATRAQNTLACRPSGTLYRIIEVNLTSLSIPSSCLLRIYKVLLRKNKEINRKTKYKGNQKKNKVSRIQVKILTELCFCFVLLGFLNFGY